MNPEVFPLTKWVWTDADFAEMGWHDATVHAVASIPETFELLFDIDYILQWRAPAPSEENFTFWIAPATLIFEHVAEIDFQLQSSNGEFSIQDIHRLDERVTPNRKMTSWLWVIEGNEGSIRFRAGGYKQYFRTQPILVSSQRLLYTQRNGLSFKRGQESSNPT